MRPQLHPSMGMTPICARIAIQLVAIKFSKGRAEDIPIGACARAALRDLPVELDGMLRLALHSLGAYIDMGWSGREWLQTVLEASHMGNTFRRCFFFEYKADRSPYPRVTNRGVQTSQDSRKSSLKEA